MLLPVTAALAVPVTCRVRGFIGANFAGEQPRLALLPDEPFDARTRLTPGAGR
jgi:hypothetical protein